jgi:hypothetical protein
MCEIKWYKLQSWSNITSELVKRDGMCYHMKQLCHRLKMHTELLSKNKYRIFMKALCKWEDNIKMENKGLWLEDMDRTHAV